MSNSHTLKIDFPNGDDIELEFDSSSAEATLAIEVSDDTIGGIDCTDLDVLHSLEQIQTFLDYVISRGFAAHRQSKGDPQNDLSKVKPRGGRHEESRPETVPENG